jgi:predicted Ser/Thr protein kinase
MPDPHPPANPPAGHPETVTGEWSSGSDRPPAPDAPTLTTSGTGPTLGELGIPNPFGRYTITRLLGRGGMGAVFLAHDAQMHRPVAVKIPTFRGTLTATQKERFLREARAIAALRHPNICPVFDVGEEQGFLFLTMAYIEGQPLAALISRGPVPQDRAVDLVRRVARAMHAAHAHGTIHRDLKPANILLDTNGEPVVMDFGLARRAQWADDSGADGASSTVSNDAGLTQYGSVLGTPAYMPPEQARGDVAAIGPRSDIYSLGVILYELLTGRRPFTATDPAELIAQIERDAPPELTEFYPWIDKGVEGACLRALAKDPADRFGTMAEFERDLKEAVEPELTVVVPPPLPPARSRSRRVEPKRRGWRAKVLTCLIVSGLLLIVCVGGPVAGVLYVVDRIRDNIKDITDDKARADAEWDAIMGFWQAPPADAGPDVLFPTTFGDGKYRRVRHDKTAGDPELGISLTGHRGSYRGPDNDEVEIDVYRCPDADARNILQGVASMAAGRRGGTAPAPPGSKRTKAVYVSEDSRQRTVTFGFHDELSQNQEYGKLWYGGGWLFWFRTAQPLKVEFFPSKYLMELGKRANAPEPKKSAPPPPQGK